jgi:hypothetical protein
MQNIQTACKSVDMQTYMHVCTRESMFMWVIVQRGSCIGLGRDGHQFTGSLPSVNPFSYDKFRVWSLFI